VMAYGVLASASPLRIENKYLWIRANGSLADEYWKRHPVPGEGSIPGKKAAQVIAFPEGNLSGAICYDYDFPQIALSNVRAGAGLAVIPAGDWRGIDPLHSDMARVMGVATGMSILRSVRSATSFASDPYGRVKAAMRFYEPGAGVMTADLPAVAVPTLYARTGDVLPWLAVAFLLLAVALTLWRRRRKA
jgi:apolipoprotein N-acyltransferase